MNAEQDCPETCSYLLSFRLSLLLARRDADLVIQQREQL